MLTLTDKEKNALETVLQTKKYHHKDLCPADVLRAERTGFSARICRRVTRDRQYDRIKYGSCTSTCPCIKFGTKVAYKMLSVILGNNGIYYP
jgi:hypothetical protein